MAHRRKKDTEKTLDFVIWLIIGIPIAIIGIFKWIFSKTKKSDRQAPMSTQSAAFDKKDQIEPAFLEDIDLMDGLTFEYYIAELLKRNGYAQVLVTRGSGDFGVDITAYKDNQKYAFQCKNYQSKLGIASIQEVYSGAPKYNASVCVVVTNSYFTSHAKEFAQSLNVKLWDRSELTKLMSAANKPSLEQSTLPYTKSTHPSPITAKQKLAQKLVILLTYAAKEKYQAQNKLCNTNKNHANTEEASTMATTLGAGKYVFGVDIPEGRYNLRAISGSGGLEIQKLIDGTWEEEYMSFGVEMHNTQTYHGLSLPKNRYFEVSGNVIFEITKAAMIEIE